MFVNNLYTIINKLFIKKMVLFLIVSKVDIKLNKNPKVTYFCTKPKKGCTSRSKITQRFGSLGGWFACELTGELNFSPKFSFFFFKKKDHY